MSKQRLHDIDTAKGLAIFLVVLGHIVAGTSPVPAGNEWYDVLRYLIYKFHMPFFMFLSGLIMFYSYAPVQYLGEYKAYVSKKAARLLPGFLLVGLIIIIGKLIFQGIIQVDNVPDDFWTALGKILLRPTESVAGSLWYIYVLFEFYLLFPLLLYLTRNNPNWLLIIGLILYFMPDIVPTTTMFAINHVFRYFLFFSLGAVVAVHYKVHTDMLNRYGLIFLVIFIISFAVLLTGVPESVSKLIIGLASIPALHAIVSYGYFSHSKLLTFLGKYTYVIYLLNTIVIGFTKGVILHFTTWDGAKFLFIAPILLLTGTFIPILVKMKIFSRNRVLNSITN